MSVNAIWNHYIQNSKFKKQTKEINKDIYRQSKEEDNGKFVENKGHDQHFWLTFSSQYLKHLKYHRKKMVQNMRLLFY